MSGADYHGLPLPAGYVRWECDVCTAQCTYEAMTQCARRSDSDAECGFDRDRPETNGGPFAFMQRGAP